MKIIFSDTSEPATKSDFDRLESLIGHALPDVMKAHYEKYNGGQPEPSCVHDLKKLFPINAFLDINEIIQAYDWFEDDTLPYPFKKYDLLPFAYDPGPGTYALSLREEDFGKVYFFTLTHIAELWGEWDSFQSFLDCIVEDPDN